jgi:hypothetical protein
MKSSDVFIWLVDETTDESLAVYMPSDEFISPDGRYLKEK